MMYNTIRSAYITPEEDFKAQLSIASINVQDLPEVFTNVRQSMHCHFESCIAVDGHFFEQLL